MNWKLDAIHEDASVAHLSSFVDHIELASNHDGGDARAHVTMTPEFTGNSDGRILDYLSVRLALWAVEGRAVVPIGTFSIREVILDSGIYALRLASGDDTRALTG